MPGMNGYKATEIIRTFSDTKKANIPIIAMTANAFDDKKISLAAGMDAHLTKPIDVSNLMKVLSDIFECRSL